MLRSVLAVVAGIVVGAFAVFALESVGHVVFPSSIAIDKSDPAQMRRLVEATPLGAKLFVVAGWFLGALSGGVASLALARRWAPVAWVVAASFLGLAAMNFFAIPHPLWMQIGAVLVCWLGGALAVKIMRGVYGPPPSPPRKPFA